MWNAGSDKAVDRTDPRVIYQILTLNFPTKNRIIMKPQNPTGPFTILELWDQSIEVSEQQKFCVSPDYEALKLWKGRSGIRALT